MRAILVLSAVTFALGLSPAAAMCGGMGGQQAQGGMCGAPAQATQAQDPFGARQSRPQQQMGMGMCPCCRSMAMMGQDKPMPGDDPHKGMEMSPKQ